MKIRDGCINAFWFWFFSATKGLIKTRTSFLDSWKNINKKQDIWIFLWNDFEKGSQLLFCSDFFLLLLNTPVKLIHNGYINRIKDKIIRTVVGFLFQNLFSFDWMKKLSQQPEVWSKNRLRFWARGKILIKSKILRFMCHVYYHHYHHYHHHYHHYHHMSWYKNPDILHFINIFPRVQKRCPFFDQTYSFIIFTWGPSNPAHYIRAGVEGPQVENLSCVGGLGRNSISLEPFDPQSRALAF